MILSFFLFFVSNYTSIYGGSWNIWRIIEKRNLINKCDKYRFIKLEPIQICVE